MNENKNSEDLSVYEISYLIASSILLENVANETESLKSIIRDKGALFISEEVPRHENLAYTMRKKTVSGSYEKYDEAYFGWFKFEIEPDKIEEIKDSFKNHLSILRSLVTSTVRENTYLGKRASAIAASFGNRDEKTIEEKPNTLDNRVRNVEADSKPIEEVKHASVEEMDKSIDEMVKEAI